MTGFGSQGYKDWGIRTGSAAQGHSILSPFGKGGNGKDGNGFGPGRKDGNGGNGFLTPTIFAALRAATCNSKTC